ncbi:MAG: DUF2188 domain-containing protein [Myxococcales bacterium]|nr:DUF2188 domain-containing protein [Myxococcales bacterium]MCB9735509.1 DUF2188 domain-containing protein [Deltaproteobacteria bacterium]
MATQSHTRYDINFDTESETWRVVKAGATRATSVCEEKDEAIMRATELAVRSRPSRVVVHDRDGEVEESRYDDVKVA